MEVSPNDYNDRMTESKLELSYWEVQAGGRGRVYSNIQLGHKTMMPTHLLTPSSIHLVLNQIENLSFKLI
jgi:hypothetical protein